MSVVLAGVHYVRGIIFIVSVTLFSILGLIIMLATYPITLFMKLFSVYYAEYVQSYFCRFCMHLAAFKLNPFWSMRIVRQRKTESSPSKDISQSLLAHEDYKMGSIIMFNHMSSADPWIANSALIPCNCKFVYKGVLKNIPLLGWNLSLTNDIAINFTSERGGYGVKSDEIKEMMLHIFEDILRHGIDVIMFPEGTRSRNRELKLFKDGFFRLAKERNVRILPAALHNSQELWHPSNTLISSSSVCVAFGDYIYAQDCATFQEMKDECRQQIYTMITEMPTYDEKVDVLATSNVEIRGSA